MDYESFLQSKRKVARPVGFEPVMPINPKLFGFQRRIVEWCLQRGRSALFADCGTGKSAIELEWARHVHEFTGRDVLILTPLAVTLQMKREGEKFGISVTVCKTGDDVRPGINVVNYERLHLFQHDRFVGLVCDESSILKAFEGTTRKQITEFARAIPYRLAATATPAPNDLIELRNHADFLDIMSSKEIIALWFTQDGNTTQKWRLKGHAHDDFYRWLASWAVAMRKPSDLGFPDDGFVLPELVIEEITVESKPMPGFLFATSARGLAEHRKASRASLEDRVQATADLVNADSEPWVVWCNLNDESTALKRAIPGSVEVRGSDSTDFKEAAIEGFSDGRIRVLISKSSICGWGLNWQHCARTVIAGSSFSYEAQYQLIRRFWRFGQTRPVHVYLVASEAEREAIESVRAKERQAAEMMDRLVSHMASFSLGRSERAEMDYNPLKILRVPDWLGSVQEGVLV